MSLAPAMPLVVATATAVAEFDLPVSRPRPPQDLSCYRKRTVDLLRRYLQVSMEIGRAPCALGNTSFRGRVSYYRLRTFEDSIIFILDVEKCLKRLDRISRTVVAHIVLENYSGFETAALTGESVRSVSRIYKEAMDRLTALLLASRLLQSGVEKLSRGEA